MLGNIKEILLSGDQFAFKLLKKKGGEGAISHFILISRNQADFAFQYYRREGIII